MDIYMAAWPSGYCVGLVILGLQTALVQTLSGASRCFLEQETLHSLLSTGWFQERIRECFNKLIAFNTIELKINLKSQMAIWDHTRIKCFIGYLAKVKLLEIRSEMINSGLCVRFSFDILLKCAFYVRLAYTYLNIINQ
jgi:hypothetical protein